jgi:hypothetical protein
MKKADRKRALWVRGVKDWGSHFLSYNGTGGISGKFIRSGLGLALDGDLF